MKKHILLFAALCLPALALLLLPEQALAADEDFVSTLVREFYNKTSTWEPTLKRYALIIFRWLLILEVCFLGIKAALNRDQIQDIFKQFIMLILMAGFFMAVINHYQEWCWNLIDGLGSIGKELTPGGYSSESPFLTRDAARQAGAGQALHLVAGQLHRAAYRRTRPDYLLCPHFRAGCVHQM